jgi:glycosyltransferase involved in cell wall biosynthesis
MAGYTYLQNLLKAIRLSDKQIEICLLQRADENVLSAPARGLADLADQVLECPTRHLRRWSSEWAQAQIYGKVLRRERPDSTLNDCLDAKHVDVVFGSWWQYPRSFVFPSVGQCAWIHDFQFVHLPQFYDAETLQATRRGILGTLDVAGRVVVSSRDALKDLLSLSPGSAEKTRVLPFVAEIPDQTYACDPDFVVRQYHLPKKFIYLPNQFWQHKNHGLVLEALRILSRRGVRPNIVCTGLPHDSRMGTYFADLLKQVSEWGLHDQLRFLGLLPVDHVKALMRQAICILNPSLFEGWSSTVEEAKSLGKRLLLSDLAVHREQDPPATVFFEPRDPEDLAQKLQTIWQDCPPGPDPELEGMARQSLPSRMRRFGEAFLGIARDAAPAAR